MPNVVVTLKKGAGRTLKQGGPWIYDNEIESIMGSFTDGDIVAVHDFVFFVKYFSLKKALEFPFFSKGFSLPSAGIMHPCA